MRPTGTSERSMQPTWWRSAGRAAGATGWRRTPAVGWCWTGRRLRFPRQRSDDPHLARGVHRFGATGDVELAHQVANVELHGRLADEQLPTDVAVRHPAGEQPE